MQICMRATADELGDLKRRIVAAKEEKGMSNAALASLAKVDASQVSRICSGSFATISANVVRLDRKVIDPLTVEGQRPAGCVGAEGRQEPVVMARTPADAERISTLLNDVAKLRRNG